MDTLKVATATLFGWRTVRSEIGVVFNEPNDRLWLPRLRKWILDNRSLLERLGVEAIVEPLGSCDEAIHWREDNPLERVLITVGFRHTEISALEGRIFSSGEPIIVGTEPGVQNPDKCGSASVLIDRNSIYCSDIPSQIRKSLIRSALLRKGVQIRQPRSDAELSGYLSLRYSVWKAIGYLRDENKLSRVQWEIDFWDRTAIPLCAITADGRVVGCTRVIRSFGDEEQSYVTLIQRLLDSANDPQLNKLFKFPNAPTLPFDVLFQFPGFGKQFKNLIERNVNMAEIGRVVVHPDHRGHCLSEVLVDTAASLAKQENVSLLFLACHEELGPLYSKCGFSSVEGLHSANFFNIQVPSIVMEKRI
jgi:predicted GNAT family N-acyltransferase